MLLCGACSQHGEHAEMCEPSGRRLHHTLVNESGEAQPPTQSRESLVHRRRVRQASRAGPCGVQTWSWRWETTRRRVSRDGRRATWSRSFEIRKPDWFRRRPARRVGWWARSRRGPDLKRTACPRCGHAMRLIARLKPPGVLRRIRRHLGQPLEVPPPAPARAPPSSDDPGAASSALRRPFADEAEWTPAEEEPC
jgi:hypothetical protein